MAISNLFASSRRSAPATDTVNAAGGRAYQRSPQASLALYAATGCLNGTYYASDEEQLDTVLALCAAVEPDFVARTAIHARRRGHMKDLPALLLASLAARDGDMFAEAFGRVIDSGRMLRGVVQILRSGRVGRRSLGSRPKRLVQQWLQQATDAALIHAAIGQQPSLADVIRMAHPKPVDGARAALYAWVLGRPYDAAALPQALQAYEAFKRDPRGELPELPFQYFTALPLDAAQWTVLARRASWQALRMNLNTFARHGVFNDAQVVLELAGRLRDPREVTRARVFPYQLLVAAQAGNELPVPIVEALADAMEVATRNVPVLPPATVVAVDVSGSMASPVTGWRRGATTRVRCIDVAALVAACIVRTNPEATVMPFDTEVRNLRLDASRPVMEQATRLAALCGGGTTVSAPLAALNRARTEVGLLVLVSDNESWADTHRGRASATMREWARLKKRCPQARLVCIDLQPNRSSQVVEQDDILHVGGFSDEVFELLAAFAAEGAGTARWVERIASIPLERDAA